MKHKDVTYSLGNTANNFKWSRIYKNIKPLCCTPETNIIL